MAGFGSSAQLTIGTAIQRASESGHQVRLLVDGHWLVGRIVAADGYGVVLEAEDGVHTVARLERVAAITLQGLIEESAEAARPMPGPDGP